MEEKKHENTAVTVQEPSKLPEEFKTNLSYFADKVVGKGSFGTVYEARVGTTNQTVAIKKVFQDKRYKNRELQIMKSLIHPNIVELRDSFYENSEKEGDVYLNLVMEFFKENAYRIMKYYIKDKQNVPLLVVKLYTWQLLRALAQLHFHTICHRDIKPQNLLIDPKTHILKLCDFGSAKRLIPSEPNVSYICSRYYRAPELIFNARDYTTAVDIWSVGCVTAELLTGRPLFPGETGTDQLVKIIGILGTPNRKQISDMNPDFVEYKFPHIKATPIEQLTTFKKEPLDELAVNFLKSLLKYSPQERPNALEALRHRFFDELRDENTKLPSGESLPELFNWTNEEKNYVGDSVLAQITPNWYNDS